MNVNASAKLLDVAQTARRLHVSTMTVYRAVWRGELEAMRLGEHGQLRISEDALEAFLRPAVERGGAG
jgi:excisionase family DNA binding protein